MSNWLEKQAEHKTSVHKYVEDIFRESEIWSGSARMKVSDLRLVLAWDKVNREQIKKLLEIQSQQEATITEWKHNANEADKLAFARDKEATKLTDNLARLTVECDTLMKENNDLSADLTSVENQLVEANLRISRLNESIMERNTKVLEQSNKLRALEDFKSSFQTLFGISFK